MRLEERPWVGMGNYVATIDGNRRVVVNLGFTDVGKTPLLQFTVRVGYVMLPKGQAITIGDIKAHYRPQHSDPTGEFNFVNFGWANPDVLNSQKFSFIPIKQSEWDSFLHGDSWLYGFAEARYQDVFGRTLTTHFCQYSYYVSGVTDRQFAGCGIYIDTTKE